MRSRPASRRSCGRRRRVAVAGRRAGTPPASPTRHGASLELDLSGRRSADIAAQRFDVAGAPMPLGDPVAGVVPVLREHRSSSTPVPWAFARRTPPARTASSRPGTPPTPSALTSIGSMRSPSSRRYSTSIGSRPASERSHSRRGARRGRHPRRGSDRGGWRGTPGRRTTDAPHHPTSRRCAGSRSWRGRRARRGVGRRTDRSNAVRRRGQRGRRHRGGPSPSTLRPMNV